jgi:general stress protein YciG
MPDHPKIDALSDKAFRLLIEWWCWCSRHLTDGFIPERTWTKRGTTAARKQLVDAGLIEITPTGVKMHDYLEHQRSADEVAELRQRRSEAGRKGGLARSKRQASAKAIAKQPAKQNPSIDRDIDITASNEAVASGGGGAAQALVGEWLERCTPRPPKAHIGQTAKHIKQLLDEGIPEADVRSGLIAWHRKNLHPATLPSVVQETRRAAVRSNPDEWMRRPLT